MTQRPFLPFARPLIGEEEITAVTETMRSGWLTTGPKTREFEKAFCEFIGAPHAVAVNSATAGLHLALEAIGVGPGDKVITTDYTFTASAEVIRYLGAEPLFADIDAKTLLIDIDAVARLIASHRNVKAIIPVHFGGLACDMTRLKALAERHNLRIVEDAAHAIPSTHKGQIVGTLGDVTVFSFYANKTMTTGEGGMITCADPKLAERMKTMRLHGISRDVFDRFTSDKATWYYEVVAPGYKYNITDIASAIGLVQLTKARSFQRMREDIAKAYNRAFADLPVILPAAAPTGDIHSWHLYVLRLDPSRTTMTRAALIEQLQAHGIGTSVHYIPLHRHPYWRDTFKLRVEDFPTSEAAYQSCVSLPIWHGMSEADVERVIATVRELLR